MKITQVGKRWFLFEGEGANGEASYGMKTEYNVTKLPDGRKKYSTYIVKDWKMTGKGARKYKNEIIQAIEEHLENKRLKTFGEES